MIQRLYKDKLCGLLKGEHYLDKFILFDKDKYYFRHFKDMVGFFEIALSMIYKININQEIKDYFIKILSAISSMKSLYIPEFSEHNNDYDKEEYKDRLNKVIENMYSPIAMDCELFSILKTKSITYEAYEIYNKEETFKEQREREQRGDEKHTSNPICYYISEGYISTFFPEDFRKKNENELMGFIKNNTGDFYIDLFIELVNIYATVKSSNNCMVYKSLEITEDCVHIDVSNAMNILIQSMVYLKNSTSFRNNELYAFDKIEIENRMEWAKSMICKAEQFYSNKGR